MGDGEITGTALETSGDVTVTATVLRGGGDLALPYLDDDTMIGVLGCHRDAGLERNLEAAMLGSRDVARDAADRDLPAAVASSPADRRVG